MRFNIITALAFTSTASAALINIGGSASVGLSATQVTTYINGLTTKATQLKLQVDTITLANGNQYLNGQGPLPNVVAGISDIATQAQSLAAQLQKSAQIPAASTASVVAAYNKYAAAQQAALSALQAKFTSFKFAPAIAAPVNAALNQIQPALNNFGTALRARLPPANQAAITSTMTQLNTLLSRVVSTVAGLLNGLKLTDILGGLTTTPAIPGLPALPGLPTGGLPSFSSLPILSIPILPILNNLIGNGCKATGGLLGGIL